MTLRLKNNLVNTFLKFSFFYNAIAINNICYQAINIFLNWTLCWTEHPLQICANKLIYNKYLCFREKTCHLVLAITLSNANRFSKLFHPCKENIANWVK